MGIEQLTDAYFTRILLLPDSTRSPPAIPSTSIPSWYSRQSSPLPSPSYRLSPTPNMGLGLFATRPIAIGEVIISEAPLFSPASTLAEIDAGIASLDDEGRALFWSFFDCHNPKSPTPLGVMRSNGVPSDKKDGDGGLFPFISRINHSCSPNVFWRGSDTEGETAIVAEANIPEGAEILVSYVPLDKCQIMRAVDLAPTFKIICECSSCGGPHDAASDRRRERLAAAAVELKEAQEKEDALASLRIAKERVRLRDEEGLNCVYARMLDYHAAFVAAMSRSDLETARRVIRLGYGFAHLCLGPDHRLTRNWLLWGSDPSEYDRIAAAGKAVKMPVICDRCGKEEAPGTKAKGGECGECHTALYCSKKCKTAHAEWHKAVCCILHKSK